MNPDDVGGILGANAVERGRFLRERGAARGMSAPVVLEYLAQLRRDYRGIAGPGGRVVSALGFGLIALTVTMDTFEVRERSVRREQLAMRIANGDLPADSPLKRCKCLDNPPGEPAVCPLAKANDPDEEDELLSCRCCDRCRSLCASDAEDV